MQVESENCEQVPEFCLQNTVTSPDEFDEGVGSFPPPSSDEQEKVNVIARHTLAVSESILAFFILNSFLLRFKVNFIVAITALKVLTKALLNPPADLRGWIKMFFE